MIGSRACNRLRSAPAGTKTPLLSWSSSRERFCLLWSDQYERKLAIRLIEHYSNKKYSILILGLIILE
jgi:hypothetical protein